MKLRILGNRIRLRLSQSEVATLSKNQAVEQHTDFGPGSDELIYSVKLCESIRNEPWALFQSNHIKIEIPEHLGLQWLQSGNTGIENKEYSTQGEGIQILIEKDFQCLHERGKEDESDSYPNPRAWK
ncbi:MAG: hypothetical protein O2887_07235 [Bacteroidetes bacterium]|nr:hypothetical protein [Bacteroidota bacterium]MDA1120273.1 hypothetical protein [Bacteroidota bacterium]